MNAQQIIQAAAAETDNLKAILAALEDGQALAALGATDADQEEVEEAHAIVNGWIAAGHKDINQVA